ncbi:MAG: hypothetical protein HC932_04710, partial [Thermales bacterium]|nr:hypothetical protein [Thermales bacterium]
MARYGVLYEKKLAPTKAALFELNFLKRLKDPINGNITIGMRKKNLFIDSKVKTKQLVQITFKKPYDIELWY